MWGVTLQHTAVKQDIENTAFYQRLKEKNKDFYAFDVLHTWLCTKY